MDYISNEADSWADTLKRGVFCFVKLAQDTLKVEQVWGQVVKTLATWPRLGGQGLGPASLSTAILGHHGDRLDFQGDPSQGQGPVEWV